MNVVMIFIKQVVKKHRIVLKTHELEEQQHKLSEVMRKSKGGEIQLKKDQKFAQTSTREMSLVYSSKPSSA